ncbi:DUF6680 family protein [Dyella sp.]|uniref:DUF6680 family protein n=1 Tax=Dyella sp. TaxID=1869338 RepID=UPI0028467C77|nr:DUF6680 family protein [Dyella sp.]MDR3445408.1 hypothetical protein [Dyella sp.]
MHIDLSQIDWAVVLATIVGPIAAVLISIFIDGRKASRSRQHWVFSTLMGLRGASLSQEHVRAINVVQVEFHKKPKVIEAWKRFLNHLETDARAEGWDLKHRDLLNDLLVKMAVSLGIDAEALDIARGGYYPTAWANRAHSEDTVLGAKTKFAQFILSPEFDQWVQRMRDTDYRASLIQAVNEQNRKPAPLGGIFAE